MKEVSQKTGILMFFTLFAAYVTFAASWVGGSNLGPQIIQTYFGHEVSPVLSQVVNYTITIARVVANFFDEAWDQARWSICLILIIIFNGRDLDAQLLALHYCADDHGAWWVNDHGLHESDRGPLCFTGTKDLLFVIYHRIL